MAELSAAIAAYRDMQAQLEADHFGEWALVHDAQLVGTYPSFEAAAEEAVARFGRGPYLIEEIGAAPTIALPASVLYQLA